MFLEGHAYNFFFLFLPPASPPWVSVQVISSYSQKMYACYFSDTWSLHVALQHVRAFNVQVLILVFLVYFYSATVST